MKIDVSEFDLKSPPKLPVFTEAELSAKPKDELVAMLMRERAEREATMFEAAVYFKAVTNLRHDLKKAEHKLENREF